MGEVVSISAVKEQRGKTLDALWTEYTSARAKAEKSLDIRDGINAGKAWAAWLDAFRAVCQ